MLADRIRYVIGVDTHRDMHALCVLEAASGALVHESAQQATRAGYECALWEVRRTAPSERVWALEGTGSYGKGLARFLGECGEEVLEVERPARSGLAGGVKSDSLDAERAARVALAGKAAGPPRAGVALEELRALLATREGAVKACTQARNELAALLLSAPDALRERLQGLARGARLDACRRLRGSDGTRIALRLLAGRIRTLQAEADLLEQEIAARVQAHAPQLLAYYGVGALSAATILCAWSYRGRVRSEAAFARIAGVAPLAASSGQVVRQRLDRGGDRRLNRALHTIVLCRRRGDPATQAYIARRIAEGKSRREASRCLKRYLCRSLFRLLERMPTAP